MARLFGKREGAWIDIPEDQVQEAYMSGMYAFAADTEINVQLKDGRYGTMPAEHAEDAFRSGASYDQADIRQERVDSASYDERNLEAGALAVARGLSFGLSDVIAENIAGYSEEELHKLEKYNANISMVGEIGGVVLPALASGGTSLVARGLAKGTIAGLSAKAGIAAEKAILGRFGAKESVAGFELAQSTANKMIQGGAALTGAATVEGALFGAVDGFSEQMLGRADRTAEQMLSHIGGITLLSGGLGGILGLASPLIGKGLKSVSESKYGKAVSDKTKDWQASILSAMHRGDKETYRRLLEPEHAHDVVFGSQKIADDVADDMGTFINDAVDGLELATRSVSGSEKQRLMREVVSAEDPLGAIDESINRLYQARQTIRAEMETSFIGGPEVAALKKADAGIQKQIDLIVSMVKDGAAEGDFVVREFGEKLRAFFKEDMGPKRDASGRFRTLNVDEGRTLKDLNTPEFFESVLPEVFIAMDSLKRAIGGVAYKRAGGPIDVATSPLMGAYHGIKNALENESLFGVVAATRQRETNQAFTDLIPSYEKFLRKFTDDGEKAGLGTASREATEGEATVMATAESKELDEQIEILSDFREKLKADRTYSPTELENTYRELDAVVAAAKRHADTFDDGVEGLSAYRKKLEVLDKKSGSLRGNLGRMKQGATPNAAKMEAIRKELNEVVEESIEVARSRPHKGLDEEAVTGDFLDAVTAHSKASEQFSVLVDEAEKNIAAAKTAVVKDPEGLVDLEKKLDGLIDRSVAHDKAKPLEKNYKKTKDLGDKKRRGRVAKWSGIKSFLKKAHKMDQSDEARVFQEFINNYGTFLSTIEREYEKGTLLTAGKTQTVKGLQNSYESLNKKWDHLGKIQLAYKEVHSAHSPLTNMLAAVPMGGLAATGPLGYLAGAATTALISPASGFKRRAMIHGIKSQVAATLNKRATHVVNRISGNMKPGAPQKARALPVLLALLGVKATGDPRKDKRAAMDGVAQLSDPNFLFARLESSTKELDEAPKIKEEIFKGMSAHANILSEASESFGAASYDPITGENETYRSDADVSKFMSIAEVGIGGTNVVADKMIAKTLTKAEGKAYREFYPIESQEFIETVLAKLAKKDEKISWDDKYQLTQLAGIPMTNTLNPVFIVSMQSIHKASVKSSGGRKNDNALKKTSSAGKTLVERSMYG